MRKRPLPAKGGPNELSDDELWERRYAKWDREYREENARYRAAHPHVDAFLASRISLDDYLRLSREL